MLLHVTVHWRLNFGQEPTDFQTRRPSVKRWVLWDFCRKSVDAGEVRVRCRGPFGAVLEDVLFCFICLLAIRTALGGNHASLICSHRGPQTSCQQCAKH